MILEKQMSDVVSPITPEELRAKLEQQKMAPEDIERQIQRMIARNPQYKPQEQARSQEEEK